MNEPVSSPSLLTITAPSKETPVKSPRAATEDFREQLSSHSKADENRTAATKKKDAKFEKSSVEMTNQKQIRSETEQEATSPGEAVPSSDTTAPKGNASELPDSEEALEALAEGPVVVAPIIVSSITEDLVVSEELFPGETIEEIATVMNEQATELFDVESDLEITVGNGVEGIVSEAKTPEAIAAFTEIVAKKSGEQVLITSGTAEGEESRGTIPLTTEITANNQSRGEQNKDKTPAEPSLLSELNDTAIQGDGNEQDETDTPAQKPTKTSTHLPAAAAVLTAAEKTLSTDDNRLDTNDGIGRNTSVSGTEERANQRAELTAAAKKRTNSAPSIDPSRFVSRVTKAFEAAQQQGGGALRIRLSPPELGMLQVQIEVKEGILTASLEAETHAARNLLLENLPALRDRLAEQQISIEKFDVDVREEQSGPEYEQTNSRQSDADTQSDRQNRSDELDKSRLSEKQTTSETSTSTPSTISFNNDRVDLVA